MASSPTYYDPRLLAKIDSLQVRARHVVEGSVAGLHRSPFYGFSIEFSEYREYTAGDDPRYLDWKVLGRTDKLYVKRFEDETNLIGYLAVDQSESMNYVGSDAGLSKYDYAATLATCLGWLILRQQDAAALVTFDEQVRQFVKPAAGGPHIKEMIAALEQRHFTPLTSLGSTLHELGERITRRGQIFVFSDFFDELPRMAAGLKRLAARRHDITLVQLLDPSELEFPFRQPTRFRAAEGAAALVADPLTLREAYQRQLREFLDGLAALARTLQLEYHLLSTDTPLDLALRQILR